MTYAPQLAQEAEITSLQPYLLDPKWVMEQKLDGHRVVLRCTPDARPVAFTRNGSLYSRTLPTAIQNFRAPDGEWILDGELVDGRLWCFDLPTSPISKPSDPLHRRRLALGTLLKNTLNPFEMVPQAISTDDKIKLSEVALKSNFEGLVLKDRESGYYYGARTANWLKVKFVTTVDCIVKAVRDDGKDSVALTVLGHANGNLIDIGRASLIGKEKKAQIRPGDVVEVKYLYVGANGRLYQPRILRVRDDKRVDECTDAQLKHVNKAVLEAL